MPNTLIWPCGNRSHNSVRKTQHSHLTMLGTNPAFMSERLYTYIRHMWGTNPTYMFEKALHLHSTHVRNQSNIHIRKGSTLTSAHARNQSSMHVKRACTHIWSCRNQSYSHIRMAPSPRLSYLVTDQVPPFSRRMVVALTSDLLTRMASTHIWHGRNLIL